jgi:endonuclease/exonuclease/phosphatase family metal-dependent hydrolase
VSPAANSLGRSRARGILGACLAVVVTAPALVLTSAAQGAPVRAAAEPTDSDITVVTANLLSPQKYTRFQRDAAEVIAQDPDLITYNEVGFRHDEFLAPEGYELWRKTTSQYTKHNAVAWRTDTWTEVTHGTSLISGYRKKPPGKTTLLGLRYANWVTLESVDGRRLNLVSTHVAPPFRNARGRTVDLLRPSVRRLTGLLEQLRGPVLVGGDFNVPYVSVRYPRVLLDEARLKPTYDLMGTSFPTGDHHDATIDYIFVRGQRQLQVDWHRPVELNSDHDAVVAGLSWKSEAPLPEPVETTVVRSRPGGTADERLAVGRVLRQHLAGTAAGDTVQLATRGLTLRLADRALRKAEARGVRVQVTTLSSRLTWRERRLLRTLDTKGSWLRRCQGACRAQWQEAQPPTLLLVTGADRVGKVRIDVSRPLRTAVVNRRTTATISTAESALNEAREAFAGL